MQAGASQHSTISHPWCQWVLVGAEYLPLPSIMRCNEVGQYGVADILLPVCPSISKAQWPEFYSYSVAELGLVATVQTTFCGAHYVAELLSLPHSSKGCDSGSFILPLLLKQRVAPGILPSSEAVKHWKCLIYFCRKVSMARGGGVLLSSCLQLSQCPISVQVVLEVECVHTQTSYAAQQQRGLAC